MSKSKSQINLNAPEKAAAGEARWRRNLKKFVRFNLWLLLVLAALHLGVNIYASALVNRQLAIASEKGEPLTIAEMKPNVPDAQNAALLYQRAYAAKKLTKAEDNDLQGYDKRAADFVARRPQLLAQNRQMFDLLRQAASRPACSFAGSWKQTWYSNSPDDYSQMRSLARLMREQASQEARQGDGEAALRDVGVIFQMAAHMKNEPVLIGFFTARSVDSIAHQALAEVLEIQPLPAPQLQAFADSLPQTDWEAAFRRSLLGERATSLMFLDMWRTYEASAAPDKMSHWKYNLLSLPFQPYMKMNEFYYLRGWRHYYDALQTPQSPLFTRNASQRLLAEIPAYAQWARMSLSIYSPGIDENRNLGLVLRHQRQNALAIAAFRAAHDGAYPANLQEAATAWNEPLLPDPYNGKPFGYFSDGQSFTLYSAGSNRFDNGGRNGRRERGYRLKNPASESADDLVWGTPKWAKKS